MPWHSETPWAAKRRKAAEQKAQMMRRIEEIEALIGRVRTGHVSEKKALNEIEEIARDGADAIVKVGHTHAPEVST
jgi:predicted phosphodiesterase